MKTITFEIEDIEWQIIADEIIDPTHWIKNFMNVEIIRHRKRLLIQEQETLIADPTVDTIPATEEGILESYFGREGYQTCAERVAAREEDPTL